MSEEADSPLHIAGIKFVQHGASRLAEVLSFVKQSIDAAGVAPNAEQRANLKISSHLLAYTLRQLSRLSPHPGDET